MEILESLETQVSRWIAAWELCAKDIDLPNPTKLPDISRTKKLKPQIKTRELPSKLKEQTNENEDEDEESGSDSQGEDKSSESEASTSEEESTSEETSSEESSSEADSPAQVPSLGSFICLLLV